MDLAAPPPDPRLHDGVGCWLERLTDAVPSGRPALFVDRDGVLLEEAHYLADPAAARLHDGVAAAIARCNAAGVPVIVVTNQAGIGRGYYGWPEFAAVQAEMIRQLAAGGARLDLVLACAYHDVGRPPYGVADHPWRKPNPGMIRTGADLLAVDSARSVLVGDKVADLEAAVAAGLGRAVLVRTGYGRQEEAALARTPLGGPTAVTVADDLAVAVADLFAAGWG